MKIHVISLQTSTARREKIANKLFALGLEFTFFDAVDGSRSDIREYDDARRMWEKGHALTRGEQGCFASHRALWEACLNAGEPFLIMEDDIEFSDTLLSVLHSLNAHHSLPEYLRLARGIAGSLPGIGVWVELKRLDEGHAIVKYMRGPSGTNAYILTPSAAEKFLLASTSWIWPVDDFMDKEFLHQVNNCGVEPPLAWQGEWDSEIGDRQKPKNRSLISRIRKEYYRAKEKLLNDLYNYMFFIKHRCAK